MTNVSEHALPTLFNIEAEAALLGALLIDNRTIDAVVDRLGLADFFEPMHGRIFEAIARERALGNAVSPVTLRPYFEVDKAMQELGGPVYLARLSADGQGLMAIRTLIDQIVELSRRRTLRAGLIDAANACFDMELPVLEIVANADAALVLPEANHSAREMSAAKAMAAMRESNVAGGPGVTCESIAPADESLGALRPGQLVVVAARPGMGKTAFAISYAAGAAQRGHGVLFVSLEMPSEDLAERLASDLAYGSHGREAVPYAAIRNRDLSDWQRSRLAQVESMAHELPLYITDPALLRIGQLDQKVRRFARRLAARGQRLDLVIVDYLQLLHPDTRGRSEYEAISEVSRTLKAIAKQHGVAVMALAQLSREVEKRPDKRPQLSDLRGSGQIEQDADIVAFLLREECYLRQAEPEPGTRERFQWEAAMDDAAGRLELIVAKKRAGLTGTTYCRFEGGFQAVRGEA